MRLGEFKVGDKIHYVGLFASVPPHIYSTVLYVGLDIVLLRNWRGVEFARERNESGFELWQPTMTYDQLKEENLRLRVLGNDLVSAIDCAGSAYVNDWTPHMRMAVCAWRNRDNV